MASFATESERTLCRELRAELPSSSRRDTEQSKEELADFLDFFERVCG